MVPDNVYQKRMAACRDCYRFDRQRGICGACGCFMTIKARGAHTECPMSVWGKFSSGSLN